MPRPIRRSASPKNRPASRDRRRQLARRRLFRPALEMLEDRRLLAGLHVINVPDQVFPGEPGDDIYQFSQASEVLWDNTEIEEKAGEGLDVLDFSLIDANLTFEIKANHEVIVTGDGMFATATHVEVLKAGLRKNVFLVEKGAEITAGKVIGNAAAGSTTIVSFSSDPNNPDALLGGGVTSHVEVNLGPSTLGKPDHGAYVSGIAIETLENITQVVGGRSSDLLVAKDPATGQTQGSKISGGKGHDNVIGARGDDELLGDSGDDRLEGQLGNDLLQGGSGNDLILAGDANDTLFGNDGDDQLFAGAGNDRLEGGTGNDVLSGDGDLSAAVPGGGDDILLGGDGNDVYRFDNGWGRDSVIDNPGNGQDSLDFSGVTASLQFTLGSGNAASPQFFLVEEVGNPANRAEATNFLEKIIGGGGVNTYAVSANFAAEYAPDGLFNKTLTIQNGLSLGPLSVPQAVLDLSAINVPLQIVVAKHPTEANGNQVTVTFDPTRIVGALTDKQLVITNVASIFGGQQNDTIVIEEGATLRGSLDGAAGSNTLEYLGRSVQIGGTIIDPPADAGALLAKYAAQIGIGSFSELDGSLIGLGSEAGAFPAIVGAVSNVQIVSGGKLRDAIVGTDEDDKLQGGPGTDLLFGQGGNDELLGKAGDDLLGGGAGNDHLLGDEGRDVLDGGTGDDRLEGGGGNDLLHGGASNDTLEGGAGADTFAFEDGWGQDTIGAGRFEWREDTLDFRAVTADLTYSFSDGNIQVGTGAFQRDVFLSNSSVLPGFQKASGTFTDTNASVATILKPGVGVGNKISGVKIGSGQQTMHFGNQWTSVTIDTSQKPAEQELIFDFSAASETLRFVFNADGSLEVTNLGTFSPISTLRDDIPILPGAPTVRITKIDAHTKIQTGRHENIFRVAKEVQFDGEVIISRGWRWSRFPGTESPFPIPTGLSPGNRVDLTKTLGQSLSPSNPKYQEAFRLKHVVNLQTLDPTTIFRGNFGKTIDGLNNVVPEPGALGQPTISDISFGVGLNILQGDLFGNDFKHKTLRPGLHILSGLTGADTYRFGNLWGLGIVAEFPDLNVGGQPIPEALDTLDFSGMLGDVQVDVYSTLPSGICGLDHLAAVAPEVEINFGNASIGFGNFVVVRDRTLGNLLAGAIPALDNPLFEALTCNITSTVVASDIEALVGPSFGNMTVRLHGTASLRGTISAGSLGTVTLDYSQYAGPVTVDAGNGLSNNLPAFIPDELRGLANAAEALILSGGSILPGAPITAIAGATGVGGHRLGGLTTLADLFGPNNTASQVLADIAVTGLTRVIGSPAGDTFSDDGGGVTWVVGENDTFDGAGGRATLDLFATEKTGGFVVDPQAPKILLSGADYATGTTAANIISGRGNDTLVGDAEKNTFYFRVDETAGETIGWGADTVFSGGGSDVLDFTGVPSDWTLRQRPYGPDAGGFSGIELYFTNGQDNELIHKVILPNEQDAGPPTPTRAFSTDFTLRTQNGIFTKEETLLSADSLVVAAAPGGLAIAGVPASVVEAAIRAFDGTSIQVPRTDGSGSDTFLLSVVEVQDGTGGTRIQLVSEQGSVVLDAATLQFVVADLPDRQLAARLLGGEIVIDSTAGDLGWHVDPNTPPASDKVDLTSVVLHELAQRLRLDEALDVMQAALEPGAARRSLPASFVQSGTPFNEKPLEVLQLPTLSLTAIDAAVDAVIDEAVLRWQAVSANFNVIGNSGASVTIVRPLVEIADLPGSEIARTLPGGTIVLDPTAAGHGWFVDDTPATDDDVPAARVDLLTVLMHEMGHAVGLGHDAVEGAADLLDESLAPGVRINPPTGPIDVLALDSSDQSKLMLGLEAFGSWVAALGQRLDQTLTDTVQIPFLGGVSIAGIFGLAGGAATKLTQGLEADIIDQVAAVFGPGGDVDGDGVITNLDLAGLPNVEFAPSTNAVSFMATVGLPSLDFNQQFAIDVSTLNLAGIDPATLGLRITSENPPLLNVAGGIDLVFVFGLDPEGGFYVETPQLVASLSVNSGPQPFDISVGLGPFGLAVEEGRVELTGEMTLGTSKRLTYDALVSNDFDPAFLLPTLSGGARYDIHLPIRLQGALAGLGAEGLAIRASGDIPSGLGSLETLVAGINLETPGLSDLFSLRQISLDQILDAIIAGLDRLAADDSVIYQKLPGVNQSAVEMLGGGTNLIQQLRDAVNSFRNGDLGSLEAGLNAKFNEILGPGTDAFRLEYQDSRLLMGLSFEKAVAGAEVAFAVDLADIIDKLPIPPLPGGFNLQELIANNLDISLGDADGEIKLGVEGLIGVDLGFGFDLTNVLDPQTFITAGSGVFIGLEAGTQSPVDFEVKIDLGQFGKVGFLIDNATANLRLDVGYGLADNDTGFYSFSEIGADDLEVTVGGRAAIDLPLFLTPQFPVGGSTADRNADGFGDNVLHVGVQFVDGELDFEIAAPYMDQLFSLAALLNDPANVLAGLETMFDVLQSDLQSKFSVLNLPLLEDALTDAASFVAGLRDDVLGIKVGGTYTGGRLGQKLQEAVASEESVIELVQRELFAALSNVEGLNLLRARATDELGNLLFDDQGRPRFIPIEAAEEIGLTITDDAVQFNFFVADTIFHNVLPLSFDAAAPGLGLKTSGTTGLELDLSYVMGLGFGLSATDLVYLDTSGVTDSGAELSLNLDVTVTPGSRLEGQLGFLRVMLEDAADGDGASGLFGEFEIDLRDGGGDGRWALLMGESLDVTARLTAVANADLNAQVDIPASQGLVLPKLSTVLHYDQVFAEVELGTGGASASFGQPPIIVFENVTLDLGQFVTGFIGPLVSQVAEVTQPLEPLVRVLTDDIQLLVDLGSSATTLIDIAGVILGPTKYAPVVKAVRAIAEAIEFVNSVNAFVNSGAGNIQINFGTFTIGGDLGSPGGATPLPAAGAGGLDPQADVDRSPATPSQKAASKSVLDKVGTTQGSFQFPLLTDPLSAVGLLLGKDADLFLYDLPGLDLKFNFVKSFPIFPGLNARFGGEVAATTNFSFGFDTTGLRSWADSDGDGTFDFQGDPLSIFGGFFIDDHVNFSGETYTLASLAAGADAPEATVSAAVIAGASVGVPGLIEAGVEGGIRGTLAVNLHDVPQLGTGAGTGFPAEYDGKIRGQELFQQISVGCVFDTSGKLSAFLDAFFWVGLDLGLFGKVTVFEARQHFLNEVLAQFDITCPDFPQPDLASLSPGDGTLTLHYVPGPGDPRPAESERYFVSQRTMLIDEQNPSLGSAEYVLVQSRGYRERHPVADVTSIFADGTALNDEYIIDSSVAANIELRGGMGNDVLQINSTNSTATRALYGEDGNDILIGGDGIDALDGGAGDDMIQGRGGNDTIVGGSGQDVLLGEAGDDTLDGGAGDDRIEGGSGNDAIAGGLGDDFLKGNEGNDTIHGDAGDDTLTGGPGGDNLFGDAGADTFEWFVGDGSDATLAGGDSTVPGGGGAAEHVDTFKLFGAVGRINDAFLLRPNAVDGANVDALITSGAVTRTLLLSRIERIAIEAGEGSDSITVHDLSNTTAREVDVDFGQGEILETVTITEDRPEEAADGSVVVVQAPRVFLRSAAFAPGSMALQTFTRQAHEGGLYQFDASGNPVLVTLVDAAGNNLGILVQQNLGGDPLFDAEGGPILEAVETRTIQRSKQVERPVFDANGQAILSDPDDFSSPQLTEVFITPEFGIDSQPDVLRILGTENADNFAATTSGDAVRVTQTGGTQFVLSSPRRADDRLILETLGGDDIVTAASVTSDLVRLEMLAGAGNDTITTSSFADLVDAGADNDTVNAGISSGQLSGGTGADLLNFTVQSASRPRVTLDDDNLLVERAGMTPAALGYSGFESLAVDLGVGSDVTVLSTLISSVPAAVTIGGSEQDDTFTVESLQAPLRIELNAGDNIVALGKNGSMSLFTRDVEIVGGAGRDRLIFDRTKETANLDVTLGAAGLSGLILPVSVGFDDAVEQLDLRLGFGNDQVAVELGLNAGGSPAPAQDRQVLVSGGLGTDTLAFTLHGPPIGTATGPSASATGIENVVFTNAGNDQPTDWLITQNQLRAGTPGDAIPGAYEQIVLQTSGAALTELNLGDGAGNVDRLVVWDTVDHPTRVNLRGGDDAVQIGQASAQTPRRLADIARTLILDGGPGANSLVIDDTAGQQGSPGSSPLTGTLSASRITGFGVGAGASVDFANFADGLTFRGSTLADYRLTLTGTSAPTTVQLGSGADTLEVLSTSHPTLLELGAGLNQLTVRSAAEPLTVLGGPGGDKLTVAPLVESLPLTAAILDDASPAGDSLHDGLITVAGVVPGIHFADIDDLELRLGPNNDTVTLDSTFAGVNTAVFSGGGDDQITVARLGGNTNVNAGGGDDTLIVEIPGDPVALINGSLVTRLTFDPGLELLVLDNSGYSQPVDWIATKDGIFIAAPGERLPLIDNANADDTRILAGAASSTILVEQLGNTPSDVAIDGNRVELVAGQIAIAWADSFIEPNDFAGLQSVKVSADGRFIYAVDPVRSKLVVLGLDAGGSLTLLQTLVDGVGGNDSLAGASDVEISADGQHVYVVAPGNRSVVTYRRDLATGLLSSPQVLSSLLFDRVTDVVLSPDGSALYAAAGTSGLNITFRPVGDTLVIEDPGQTLGLTQQTLGGLSLFKTVTPQPIVPIESISDGSSYADLILGDNPVAYYRLNELSGAVAADATGSGRTGTYVGSVTRGQVGALVFDGDPAVRFEGGSAVVTVADAAALRPTSLSLEAWVRRDANNPQFATVVMKTSSSSWSDGYGLYYLTDGTLNFFVNHWSSNRLQVPLAAGAWTHVVGTFDGTSMKLYLNGDLRATKVSAALVNSTQPLRIGSGQGTYPWLGAIDEVAVYPLALTAAQVQAHYQTGHSGPRVITIDTSALSITGDDDNGDGLINALDNPQAIYGQPFTASVSGGIATFVFPGDLHIGADTIRATGANAVSIVVGGNLYVDEGASLSVSASLATSGPGGGGGGLGPFVANGGAGGPGAVQTGRASGGTGGTGNSTGGSQGSLGAEGTVASSNGGSGLSGASGNSGAFGLNNAGIGLGGNPGIQGQGGATGTRQTSRGSRGAGGDGCFAELFGCDRDGDNGGAGSTGNAGQPGQAGQPGGVGSPGSNLIVGPLLAGGTGGGSGGSGGGGGGGGGGSSGTGGGGGGGGGGETFCGFLSCTDATGTTGGQGGRGGEGGEGGHGGHGGVGGHGGAGGGAFQIVTFGQIIITSAEFQAQGGAGQSGSASTSGQTNGSNAPEGGSTGDQFQAGAAAATPSRSEIGTGGTGGAGMDGGAGGNGAVGGVGGAGASGAGGTIKLVGSVIDAGALTVSANGGTGGLGVAGAPDASPGGSGRFLYAAHVINGEPAANFAATPPANPVPVSAALRHQWTFEGTTADAVGTANGRLFNGAQIADGRLILDGVNDYMRTTPIGQAISTRTTIVWASLGNLTQRAGSMLTLENPTGTDVFDGIVYGERVAGQWMNGSNQFQRSVVNNGGSAETLIEPAEVMIAIVNGPGNAITIYRNGVPCNTLSATLGTLQTYPAGVADVLFGLRASDLIGTTGTPTGTDGYFAGAIEEARIYGGVLTPQDIQNLYQQGPVSSQNNLPPGWNVNAQPAEFFVGPMAVNPFLDEGISSTPTIPNLQGGADAYGLLQLSASALLSDQFLANVPTDAIAALVRVDAPPAGLTADFAGYDLLLYVNLSSDFALDNPHWSAGGGSPLPLLAGGLTNNPLFNGGGFTLAALGAGQIYAMLIAEETQGFALSATVNVWDFTTNLASLADGEVTFLTVDRAGQPLAAATDSVTGEEYVFAADPDLAAIRVLQPAADATFTQVATLPAVAGPTTLVIDSAHRFLYATQAADNALVVLERTGDTYALVQTMQEGVAGVRGLAGASSAALSPDETFLYVTAGLGHSLAAFRRDPATGLLDFVQQLSNGNSTTLGLQAPNSVVVDSSTGLVIVGSSDGVGLSAGGVATFLGTAAAATPLTDDGFTLTFDGPLSAALARLTIQTGGQADRILQVHPANVVRTEIFTADGDDMVDLVAAAGRTHVDTGAGQDIVELRSAGADTDQTADTGDDADTIVLRRNGPNSTTTLIAGGGNDVIQIAGHQLQSAVSVDGGEPTTVPGDNLLFESGGIQTTHDLTNQTIQVPAAGIVSYASIEKLDIIAPANVVIAAPAAIAEGAMLTLDASGTNTFTLLATFAWDINGDGQFGDFTGETLELSWPQLVQFGLDDDGVYSVAVRVTTNFVSEATTLVVVTNTAPVLALAEMGPPAFGLPYRLDLSATDPGDDTIRQWQIDWGDGTTDTLGSGAVTATHVYQGVGAFDIQVLARDEDNPAPAPAYMSSRQALVAPQVPATSSVTIDEGQSVLHPALVPAGALTDYQWAYPYDGQTFVAAVSRTTPVLTWRDLQSLGINNDGAFMLGVQATSNGATSSVGTLLLTVNNAAPSATFTSGGANAQEGDTVSVAFSGPADPSAADVAAGFLYSYDFDNDSVFEISGVTSPSAAIAITQAGTQVVRGRIADKDGGFRDYFTSITTAEVAPSLLVVATGQVTEGAEYTLALSATDPGDDRITRWIVRWGDGQSDEVLVDAAAATADVSLTHVFADDGTYQVRVTAIDNDGAYDLNPPHTVVVSNVDPVIGATGPATIAEGSPLVLSLADDDPGSDAISLWTIDWGDGANETIAGSLRSAAHVYADDGAYQIRVTAVDEDTGGGAAYAASVVNVAVTDVAPTASVTGSAAIVEGSFYTLAIGTAVDPGDDPIIEYVVDWGDGTNSTLLAAGPATHTYHGAGPRTITLNLVEQLDDGNTQMWTSVALKTIEVGDLPPVITLAGNSTVPNRQVYTLSLGAVVDPGEPAASVVVNLFVVRWGDGTSDSYSADDVVAAGGLALHTFPAGKARYPIAVDLITDQGDFARAGSLEVEVINLAPVAGDDETIVPEDGAVAITVLANDTDGNDDLLTIVSVPQPASGAARINANGTITYTPRADFHGTDSFSYAVSDGQGGTVSATVQVTITPVNDPPVITSGGGGATAGVSAAENQTAVVTVTSADVDGDVPTYSIAGGDDAVLFRIHSATGELSFLAAPDFEAPTDADADNVYEVIVQASDAADGADTQLLAVTVINVNDAPTDIGLSNDAVAENQPAGTLIGTLATTDADAGQTFTYALSGDDAAQFLVVGDELRTAALFDYESRSLYHIIVTSTDQGGLSVFRPLTIMILNVAPSQPVDNDPAANHVAGGAASGTPVGITAFANDPAGGTVTYALSDDAGGRFAIDFATGVVTVQSGALLNGPATHLITIQASDGLLTAAGTFTIMVMNVAPQVAANSQLVAVDEGQTATSTGTWSDADGDLVVLTSSVGTVVQSADGTWTWSWLAGNGPDDSRDVTITATDSDGSASTVTFQLTVNNLAPIATDDGYTTAQGTAISGNVITDNAGNGPDNDAAEVNDPLTVTSYSSPSNGTLALNPDGSFTYTPTGDFAGIDSFSYTISDGDGDFATATVTIQVAAAPGMDPGAEVINGVLRIVGTPQADLVGITRLFNSFVVAANFLPGGWRSFPAGGVERIVAMLGDGNDLLVVAGDVGVPAILDGGGGNDLIYGGGGASVILGGLGDDLIVGGGGRNVLIGGAGRDTLVGAGASDLLIAGTTSYDANHAALDAILTEWTSSRSYAERVANLRDGLGPVLSPSATRLKKGVTVFDDEDVDQLFGGSELDWFLFDLSRDIAWGKQTSEQAN